MDIQAVATGIVRKLNEAGFTAYFAGGWVRDFLMGHPSDDIDIATNAPPEKILELFPKTILVGLSFGIVVVVEKGHQFEVATFRKDIDYVDGRKPSKIELATAEEDASRRDFTINGMFYDPINHVVHDFVKGAEDIQKGVVRTIGNANDRFVEDRLRMIRAVRFAARFGFTIDQKTQEAILSNAETLFPSVALERVWQELTKMSKYPHFDSALIEMQRLKLLPIIFPNLKPLSINEIENFVSGFKYFPKKAETILYLMELFPKETLEEVQELCNYLRTSTAELNLAKFLILMRQSKEVETAQDKIDLYAWAHLYANPAAKTSLEILAAKMDLKQKEIFLTKHHQRMHLLKKHIERIVEKKPLVNATILMAQGIRPGKSMGVLIKEAERLTIINNLETVDEVMNKLKNSEVWPKTGGYDETCDEWKSPPSKTSR